MASRLIKTGFDAAKINWSPDITGQREDGYHLMDMIMQPVSLADEVTLTPAADLSITTGGWPPIRADEANLAYRAALALKERIRISPRASGFMWKRRSLSAPAWAAAARTRPQPSSA